MSNTEPRVEARPDRRSVLPWRRHHVDVEVAPLISAYRDRHRKADTALIEQAFEVARVAHVDQVRRSGEPYIAHPLGVAMILADLGLDDVTIAAALLHDAVEDTTVTDEDLQQRFGPDVAAIVDGVTKLDRLQFDSKEAQQAATLRKMLVAMAKDIRVLLIKLADRLHNMRTISSLPDSKQQRIAQETLDIYAPLAHRLGIADVKWQLEDLAFDVLHPKRYAEIEQMVTLRAPEREQYLEQVLAELRARLAGLHIDGDVRGRPKNYWSIYEKMVVQGKEFDDVQDLLGVRVVVESVKDCYAALGSIHAMWKPVQGRFKDYIAMPKFNLYQSLHTTVVGPQGKLVEVQIRTEEMHRRAEYGVAAHWGYKEKESPAQDMVWLERMVDWQQETSDPGEFMETLKIDLEQDEVFVFTPKGKVITLAAGATPVDFAYTIHTEVGHRCIGAKVNGRLVPLDSTLASGDTVDLHQQGRRRGPEPRLAPVRADAPSAQQDPPVVLAGAARGRDRDGTRRAREGAPQGRPPSPEAGAIVGAGARRRGDELRRPRRAVRRGRRRARLAADGRAARPTRAARRRGAAARHGPPATAHVEAAHGGRPRRGPRRRHGAAVALLYARARRRDHGLRDPRSGCLRPPHRLRQRRRSGGAGAPRHRRRLGSRPAGHLRRVRRGRGAGPVAPLA
jgi:ppGpp synthetase/RelA/SpoT-type nucleotidyltranferase